MHIRSRPIYWFLFLIIPIFLFYLLFIGFSHSRLFAVVVDATTQPLVASTSLQYVGAFRLPSGTFGAGSFDYANGRGGYNPVNNTLFLVGTTPTAGPYDPVMAEVSIPTPVNSPNLVNLNTATVLQPFADMFGTKYPLISIDCQLPTGNGCKIGGALVYNNQLYTSAGPWYAVSNTATSSHFVSPLTLSQSAAQVQGPFKLGNASYPEAGYVNGTMGIIPAEWQPLLGGPAYAVSPTGNSGVNSQSTGPSFTAFNPSNLGAISPIPALSLLWYSNDTVGQPPADRGPHPTLGNWSSNTTGYDGSTHINGSIFPTGTRSVLYFGSKGLGNFCYGAGTSTLPVPPSNPSVPGGFCYDPPSDGTQGGHNYYNASRNSITTTGTVVAGSNIITNIPSTAGMVAGMTVDGLGSTATTIISIDSPTQISLQSGINVEAGGTAVPFTAHGVSWTNKSGYVYYVWAYDANDLLAVKNGIKNPWDPIPYATWELTLPFAAPNGQLPVDLGMAGWDPITRRLYLTQMIGDGTLPIVYVYTIL